MKNTERRFYLANLGAVVVGTIVSLVPFFFREYHSWSNARRIAVRMPIFLVVSGMVIYPFYKDMRTMNQQLLKNLIFKIKE